MKQILIVFLGLVLLSQVIKFCERGQAAASVKRPEPARMHPAPPGRDAGPKVMVA